MKYAKFSKKCTLCNFPRCLTVTHNPSLSHMGTREWWRGVSHLWCPCWIWNCVWGWGWGVSHLSMSRWNLKSWVIGGQWSFHVHAKSEILGEVGGFLLIILLTLSKSPKPLKTIQPLYLHFPIRLVLNFPLTVRDKTKTGWLKGVWNEAEEALSKLIVMLWIFGLVK